MISVVRARMRRRLLVTYRVDPDIAAQIVPAPFRPQLVRGSAVGGLCLIRLEALRPGWLAPEVGASSEAVAHRFAVEWDEGNVTRHGVYVSHRHSSSAIAGLAGGRVFPGIQQHARIHTEESATRSRVRVQAGAYSAQADVEDADDWASELFDTPQQASDFYRAGAVGWSPRRGGGVDAVSLAAEGWAVRSGRVHAISSAFFDGLPAGSARFDSALVMRDLAVTWRHERAAGPTLAQSGESHRSHRFTGVACAP